METSIGKEKLWCAEGTQFIVLTLHLDSGGLDCLCGQEALR